MISKPELLREGHDFSTFDCGKPALNDWLKSHAFSNQSKGFSRVIVITDDMRVIGYYGLAPTAAAPSQMSRGIRTGRHPDPIPAILLGQFAVDRDFAGRGIGSALLRDALYRAIAGADAIGGRAVIVRAIDAGAEEYWKSNGFIASKDDPSLLFRSVADIRSWLSNPAL
jgi:GNAT superfamily N-acetyltransferase